MFDRYKNWKTSTAFGVFVLCFAYAVYKENPSLVEATGFIALVSWALLKASSDTLNNVVLNISEAFREFKTKGRGSDRDFNDVGDRGFNDVGDRR